MTATRSSAAPLTSLAELIAGLSPRLDATEYVFVQLDETAIMPMASEILASFREAEGTTLASDTDTEVVANLISSLHQGDLRDAVARADAGLSQRRRRAGRRGRHRPVGG